MKGYARWSIASQKNPSMRGFAPRGMEKRACIGGLGWKEESSMVARVLTTYPTLDKFFEIPREEYASRQRKVAARGYAVGRELGAEEMGRDVIVTANEANRTLIGKALNRPINDGDGPVRQIGQVGKFGTRVERLNQCPINVQHQVGNVNEL
ncbi:MAG: hypothetical protein AUJ92_10285 [Armatimonadetes bacterium CG2_30_59_28]|nr:MAG: hypothetical protein AUJ92_10285 [Armatimonadetes bacterium CG2_30_59_28]PIU65686.1 MAG: hypothetical protein COS85_07815 [Armatimonadetes bacterium CG07_land_8_20_14_0_80_59_28]PIX45582.1 MAG: hypothetical protein COZ56_01525 [Armatimonadetes bacterium CG_4_8_14_3_um_filter_58_9]PIY39047.1 MAG: hypothetical protein COZ05_19810 [Armatimonadetes bacterium CG_4_10_14_3_um_filter_59_10]PJB64011.1 MAG: hypothetical protein CO095_15365 [Armatimonadetes bacterium CG_4_9_14_3_um_filter_58_7]